MKLRKPKEQRPRRPQGRGGQVPASLPEVVLAEIVEIDADGEALARPVDFKGGKPPRIFLAPATGHSALGVGDRALMRLKRLGHATFSATVLRRVEGQNAAKMVGVYVETAQGGRLTPTDRRQKDEVIIQKANSGGAENGELAVAEIIPGSALGLPQGKIIERLGPVNAPRAVSLISIHTFGLPLDFPEAVVKEAEKCPRPTLGARTDLRDIPLVTIDGADARDFDDAVYAERDGEGWKLLVAIADVANYVKHGSALDREAIKRGNSTYFPDRVVPMLPEALSNDLCSLKPHEDRACLAVWMWVGADGKMVKYQFVRGLMRSKHRLTYEQVQSAWDGGDAALAPIIAPLYGAYKTLLEAREARGTLELDLPERKAELDEKGRIKSLSLRQRLDSHKLIEEFMILANVAAAEALETKNLGTLYRVHEPPSMAKLEMLKPFLESMNINMPAGKNLRPASFRAILEQVADTPVSSLVSMVVLRSQSQAIYSPDNRGHFGLALAKYAHFTSPIRRYADLIVHRGLIRAYKLGDGGLTDDELADLQKIGEQISDTERRSAAAEQNAMDRYMALYMEKQVGAVFSGFINGVTRFGLFVELDETGADGLIPMNMLGGDRYDHDEKHHCLVGQRTGRTIKLGARARVRLAEANGLSGSLVFEPIEIDSEIAPKRLKKPGKFGGKKESSRQNERKREKKRR